MGVPTPAQMVEAFAVNAPVGAVAGGKTSPFPVASQVPLGFPGNASLNDGFTAANMTALDAGGIPMSGPDLNGALNLISGPVTALCAGQIYFPFSSVYATAIGGYNKGAIVQDATNPLQRWVSAVAANTADPAVTPADWISSIPLYSAAALTGVNNVALPGPSDFVINIGSAAGPFTGFVAQRDAQIVTYVNTSGGVVIFNALSGSSSAANQIQASGNIDVASGDSLTLKYSTGLGKWLVA